MSEEAQDSLKVADSMQQAAGALGVGADVLERAKAAGCGAFRGSRIYLEELEVWIEENPQVLNMSPADRVEYQIKLERRAKIRFENGVAMGKYLPREDVARFQEELNRTIKAILHRFLESELPAKGEGQDGMFLKELGAETFDTICRHLQSASEKWIEDSQQQ